MTFPIKTELCANDDEDEWNKSDDKVIGINRIFYTHPWNRQQCCRLIVPSPFTRQ